MSSEDVQILEQCTIKCPRCNAVWVTSLGVEFCDCLHCGTKLNPLKHIVVESENEVN